MRPTSVIAGGLALLAALGVVAWAITPTRPTQAVPDTVPQPSELNPEEQQHDPEPPKPRDKTGEFDSNPYTLSSEGPQPKVVIDEEVHQFGRLAVRGVGKHDFVIRNEGDAALKLAKGHTTCKCTGFDLGVKEIAPGESATIHLEWRPVEEADTFSQTATIWSNDPQHAEIKLMVEGEVVPIIKLSPGGVWTVGAISEGSSTTVKGYIASPVQSSFDITSIEVPSQFVTVTHEPMDAATLQQERVTAGHWLTCTVDPAIPVGVFEESIKVNLSLEEAPTIQINLQGVRVGPFQIIGPGWRQSTQTLTMGRCKAADGKKVQISMFVSHLPGATVEFGTPEVTPPILNVSITHDDTFQASGGRERFMIVVEAPPGIIPGRWAKETAIRVHLPCNHPDANSANISVEFQAD